MWMSALKKMSFLMISLIEILWLVILCLKAKTFSSASKPCCFIGTPLQLQHLLLLFNQHLKFVIKLHHFFFYSNIILVWIQNLIDFTWLCQNSLCQPISPLFQKGYLIWQTFFCILSCPLSFYIIILALVHFSWTCHDMYILPRAAQLMNIICTWEHPVGFIIISYFG